MAFGINDIAKVSVLIEVDNDRFILRNYGEAGTSISIRPADGGALYNRHYGAGGQALFSKSYKPKNMEMEINILRLSQDYANMQKIVQKEQSGQTVVLKCTYTDENTGEKISSTTCVLANIAEIEAGPDVNPDCTYLICMSDATMTPPTGAVI